MVRPAVAPCFPTKKSAQGREPRNSWISEASLTLMDRRSDGRRDLRFLRTRLNELLLAWVFVAWASDGKEEGEWFHYPRSTWRMSVREGPSRALLIDACEAVAQSGQAVLEVATQFTYPLCDCRGKVYPPPFTSVHVNALWKLCRMPSTS